MKDSLTRVIDDASYHHIAPSTEKGQVYASVDLFMSVSLVVVHCNVHTTVLATRVLTATTIETSSGSTFSSMPHRHCYNVVGYLVYRLPVFGNDDFWLVTILFRSNDCRNAQCFLYVNHVTVPSSFPKHAKLLHRALYSSPFHITFCIHGL